MSEWCKEHVKIMIQEYKKFPCLYEVKNAEYHNKKQRILSLEQIQRKLCEVRPETTIDHIKAKFSSLRSHYGYELRKFKMNDIGGTIEPYRPKVWWYNDMMFLKENVTSRKNTKHLPIIFKTEIDPESILLSDEQHSETSGSYESSKSLESGLNHTPQHFKTELSNCKDAQEVSTSQKSLITRQLKRKGEISKVEENDFKKWCSNGLEVIKKSNSQIYGEFVGSQMEALKNQNIRDHLEIEILKLVMAAKEEDLCINKIIK